MKCIIFCCVMNLFHLLISNVPMISQCIYVCCDDSVTILPASLTTNPYIISLYWITIFPLAVYVLFMVFFFLLSYSGFVLWTSIKNILLSVFLSSSCKITEKWKKKERKNKRTYKGRNEGRSQGRMEWRQEGSRKERKERSLSL